MDITYSFNNGMNRDIAKNKFPRDAYFYLLNGRIMNSSEPTTSGITNIKGNELANIDDNGFSREGFQIIGFTTLLDDIILFYTFVEGIGADDYTSEAIIDRLVYQGEDAYLRTQIWRGTGLNFRPDKPIKAVSRYENETLQKIYWTDNNEIARFAIISEDISAYTSNQFDFLGDFNFINTVTPTFNSYTSGSLKVGVIQYAFRFVKQYGQKTLFSPLSNVIPLSTKIASRISKNLKGGAVYNAKTDYGAGVGLIINLNLPDNNPNVLFYDYIEVVSLWYSAEEATPDINIIYKGDYKHRIVDDGVQSYGQVDLGEFLQQQSDFIAKDLAIKDDRLFMTNIKDKFFDLDTELGEYWDARAYRFSNNTGTLRRSQLLNSTLGLDYTLTEAGNYTSIAETADCINIFNNITANKTDELNTYGLQQKYQINGITLGGSGLNISYSFGYTTSDLHNNTEIAPYFLNLDIYNNKATTDYFLGIKKGFQRDEVYRFGIVFFDFKGRQSFVKWIGDIRMPYLADGDEIASTSKANNLNINFVISNLPIINGETLNYQIVYVKRKAPDKSIVSAGIGSVLNKVYFSNGVFKLLPNCKIASIKKWIEDDFFEYQGAKRFQVSRNHFEFRSPDVSFSQDYTKSFSYIELAGETSLVSSKTYQDEGATDGWQDVYSESSDPSTHANNYRVSHYLALRDIMPEYGRRKRIVDYNEIVLQPYSFNAEIRIGNENYLNVHKASFFSTDFETTTSYGLATKCNIINTSTPLFSSLDSSPSSDTVMPYIYCRNTVFDSQYGGYGYEDRLQNNYISASNINTGVCDKGDTVINLIVNKRISADLVNNPTSYNLSDDIIYMAESDYNTHLRHDTTYFDVQSIPIYNSDAISLLDDGYLNPDTGVLHGKLNQYNAVYSKLDSAKSFFILSNLFNIIEEYNTKIIYSNIKYDNEDIDSWLDFRTNNFNFATSKYGPINKIVEFKDNLFIFQDIGVAALSINPRAVVNSSEGELSLGFGATIDKVIYLTTDIGCQDNSDVIKSFNSLYWLDKNKKKLYSFDNSLQSVSDLKGMVSYFGNNISELSRFIGTYDIKNSEVLMTVIDAYPNTIFVANDLGGKVWEFIGQNFTLNNTRLNFTEFVPGGLYRISKAWYKFLYPLANSFIFEYSHGVLLEDLDEVSFEDFIIERDNFTIAYNEKIQAFTSFYSFLPSLYIPHNKGFMSSNNNSDLWQHDKSPYFNIFYNVVSPTTLKLLIGLGPQGQADFNNVKFFCEITDYTGDLKRNETISNISAKTEHRSSEDILLYPLHLPELPTAKNFIYTSGYRLGTDWYTGLSSNIDNIIIYNNQTYRSLTDANITNPYYGAQWKECELANIRKTINAWSTLFPRFKNEETDFSDRIRGDWVELTLELKDTIYDLKSRKLLLNDISVSINPI